MLYQVVYFAPDGVRTYCIDDMDFETANEHLEKFKSLYLDDKGRGKAYPNGKGFYPFKNPKVVPSSTVAELKKKGFIVS